MIVLAPALSRIALVILAPILVAGFLPELPTTMSAEITVASDTVRAGNLFITNLPDTLGGVPVARYVGSDLPARSWLRNRSFFWKTDISDVGDHALLFYVFREIDSRGGDSRGVDSRGVDSRGAESPGVQDSIAVDVTVVDRYR